MALNDIFLSLETAVSSVGKHNVLGYEMKPLDLSRLIFLIKQILAARNAELALIESEELYRTLTDSMLDMVSCIDSTGRFKYLSPSWHTITGFPTDDMLGKNPLDYMHPDDVETARSTLAIGKDTQWPMRIEYRQIHSNGSYIWIESIGNPILDANSSLTGIVFGSRDITSLKQADQIIWENRERYRILFESLKEAIYIVDPANGEIDEANPAAETMYGFAPEEIQSKSYKDITAQPDMLEELTAPSPVYIPYRLHKRADGDTFPVEITAADTTLEGYPMRLLAVRDISLRMRNREEISRLKQIETLGVIAGGIAHSFNNILTAIRGDIYYAMTIARENVDEAIDALAFAEQACLKAKELTQQMLTFSRGDAPDIKPGDIETLLRDTVEFILRGSQVKSVFKFPKNLSSVKMDAAQIAQVAQILTLNALQAMPDGGSLVVSAENTGAGEVSAFGLPAGQYVSISMKDSGPGIPEDDFDRIFDPYYTTKRNTAGLGLTIALSIITKHGGIIMAEPSPRGAMLTFVLPAASEAPAGAAGESDEIIPGSGRILILEDNEMIGTMLKKQLEHIGYKALITIEGNDTVKEFIDASEAGKPFDAVLIDLTIPGGMGGKEAVAKLKEHSPDVKAIVASGFYMDPVVAEYEKYGFKAFLPKPYNIGELSRALHKLLKS